MSDVKEHILLVDDEKHLLVSLRDYLTFEHFTVSTAQSGEEALEVLKELEPDLIVLDISMPGMGGMGFLKRISTPEGKPRYPVLVLTARSMMADFFQGIAVDGFVAKPCNEAELTGMIRSIIAKYRSLSEKTKRDKPKILLAEDDEVYSRRIGEALKAAGYEVELAASGPELLEKAAAGKPDIIVMKEILPRLNGTAVAALLEVMPSTSGIPVVLYDDALTGDEPDSIRAGLAKTIRKDLRGSNPDQLLKAVAGVAATL
jgi:CheY-like chemotaxis protein